MIGLFKALYVIANHNITSQANKAQARSSLAASCVFHCLRNRDEETKV